LASFQQEDVEK